MGCELVRFVGGGGITTHVRDRYQSNTKRITAKQSVAAQIPQNVGLAPIRPTGDRPRDCCVRDPASTPQSIRNMYMFVWGCVCVRVCVCVRGGHAVFGMLLS